jgi:hypothetical protein
MTVSLSVAIWLSRLLEETVSLSSAVNSGLVWILLVPS